MPAFLAWKDYYTVHEPSLDAEHKQIIELIDSLYLAMQRRADQHVIGDVLERLVRYTMTHFGHEENQMREVGYPELDAHKACHDRMQERTLELRTQWDAASAPEVMRFLKDWWVNHIQGDDKRYAPFMAAAARMKAGLATSGAEITSV